MAISATTVLPLQQPQHPAVARHVGADLGQRGLLGIGEVERQSLRGERAQPAVADDAAAGQAALVQPHEC
jgi:hypothetical protein